MMNMMKKIMLYIGLSVFIYGMIACDDDNLIPTTRPEFGYSVPQGEHGMRLMIKELLMEELRGKLE